MTSPAPELSPAERAEVERFGIHDPEADVSEWVVHILGMDDVYPARDMLDAIRSAHEINKYFVENDGYYSPERAPEPRPFMTYTWAVPKLREHA